MRTISQNLLQVNLKNNSAQKQKNLVFYNLKLFLYQKE